MALHVSLVSADAEVWTGEASLVVAKTVEGAVSYTHLTLPTNREV